MSERGSNKKVANSLVAVSSAAVLAVYAAGYTRTRTAAARLEVQSSAREHRPPPPSRPVPAASPEPESQPLEPAPAVHSKAVHAAAAPEPAVTATLTPDVGPVPEATAQVTVAAAAPPPPPPAPAPVWKDGTYTGWGSCRHGDIQASVVIEGGRITSATIAQCLTRYSCDVIDKLPAQVVERQSHEVDSVSGASQSADAFFFAVYEALGKAK